MKPYKLKIKETTSNQKMIMLTPYNGWAMDVQAVSYSSIDPVHKVHFYDADGDEFLFPIPGQLEAKPVNDFTPVTVKLPISYMDESEGKKQLIIFGKVWKPENPMDKKDAD